MKQQNFDSEFEHLIREKITENQMDPESLLWKRLQDQLHHNDELARLKRNRVYFLSSALVVLTIGLATLIGNVQWVGENEKQHAGVVIQIESALENSKVKSEIKTTEIKPSTQKETKIKSSSLNIVSVQPVAENEEFQKMPQTMSSVAESNEESNRTDIVVSQNDELFHETNPTDVAVIQQNELYESAAQHGAILNSDESPTHEVSTPEEVELSQNSYSTQVEELVISIPEESIVQEIILPFEHVQAAQNNQNVLLDKMPPALFGRLSYTLNLSPAYGYRTARDQSSGSVLNAAHFNGAESGKLALNGSVGVMYSFTPLITVKSGVQLSTVLSDYSVSNLQVFTDTTEKFVNVESAYGQIHLPESNFHHDDDDNPDEEEEEENEMDTTSVILSFTNAQTLRLVQIPIAVEFGVLHGKLRYIAGAGLTYGYLASAHSDFTANGFTTIRSDVRSLFNRNSLSGAVHFGVEYSILPMLSVRATPSFTYMLTKMNRTGNVSTHGFWGGIDVGLRFRL